MWLSSGHMFLIFGSGFVLSAGSFDFPSLPVQYSQDDVVAEEDPNNKGQQSVPNESSPGEDRFRLPGHGVAQRPIVTVQP